MEAGTSATVPDVLCPQVVELPSNITYTLGGVIVDTAFMYRCIKWKLSVDKLLHSIEFFHDHVCSGIPPFSLPRFNEDIENISTNYENIIV
jgi:hypothetical protein